MYKKKPKYRRMRMTSLIIAIVTIVLIIGFSSSKNKNIITSMKLNNKTKLNSTKLLVSSEITPLKINCEGETISPLFF